MTFKLLENTNSGYGPFRAELHTPNNKILPVLMYLYPSSIIPGKLRFFYDDDIKRHRVGYVLIKRNFFL